MKALLFSLQNIVDYYNIFLNDFFMIFLKLFLSILLRKAL